MTLGIAALGVLSITAGCSLTRAPAPAANPLDRVQHFIVIYEENRSFDSIWGLWPGVDGLSERPAETPNQTQVDRDDRPYRCLPQNDPNLRSVPQGSLPADCAGEAFASHFPNRLFPIDQYIRPTSETCWRPGLPDTGMVNGVRDGLGRAGGCTHDLVHRFYQEQYQIDGGRMDRFTVGSNAGGLTQGYHDTRDLPLYRYLTREASAPPYVILDHFFHAVFGGSFLNHIWLISGRTPVWRDADHSGGALDQHAVVGRDGYAPFLKEPAPHGIDQGTRDDILTERADSETGRCAPPEGAPLPPAGTACGDYAVNTVQPTYEPFSPGTSAEERLPPLDPSHRTIGDELDDAHIGWTWYAGGWDNATGNITGRGWTNGRGPTKCADRDSHPDARYPNCPDRFFQFHHQPFNYFAGFGPGTAGREHLKDEADFLADLRSGRLPAVAFVKPLGPENEHPGYTGLARGDRHLVELLRAIEADPADWSTTAVVITYDENGGIWDHVPPPTVDRWGPGTRVPAMIVSPLLSKKTAVDHTSYDTTTILTTIENRFGLERRLSPRTGVPDLGNAFR